MTLDAAELQQVTDIAARLVRETMAQAARGGLSVPVMRPGTLVAWDAAGFIASVTVDGDAAPIFSSLAMTHVWAARRDRARFIAASSTSPVVRPVSSRTPVTPIRNRSAVT